jgi:GDSL-like Lipase/Acylhydrolase family
MPSSPISSRFALFVLSIGLGAAVGCGVSDPSPALSGPSAAGAAGLAQTGGGSGGSAGLNSAGGNVTAGTMSGGASGGGGASGNGGASAGGGAGGASGGAAGGGAAGAAGTSGAGGSGGMPAYNPCPTNGDPCRVMPLGDSITWGAGSTNTQSYRAELFHLSLMNNKKLTFVGSAQDGPAMVDNMPFPKHHEGHSGWTIDDGGGRMGLYPQMQGWLAATPPDIVTLMIGTNDVDISLDLPNAANRLGLLIDRISMYAPTALIVVAQMVPTTDDNENQRVMAYNGAVPGLVKTRTDAGKHVTTVDMYGAFTKNANFKTEYMTDKLHPKDAGYTVMASTWYAAIGGLLPAK